MIGKCPSDYARRTRRPFRIASLSIFVALLPFLEPSRSFAKEVYLSCAEASGTETIKSDTIRDAASERVVKEDVKPLKGLTTIPLSINLEERSGHIRGVWTRLSVEPYRLHLQRLDPGDTESSFVEITINRQDLTFTYLSLSNRYQKVVGLLQNVYSKTRQSKGACKRMSTSGNKI